MIRLATFRLEILLGMDVNLLPQVSFQLAASYDV